MRARALFVSSLFALAACGGADPVAACENYIDASQACYAEVEVDVPLPGNYCDGFDSLKGDDAQRMVDILDCYTDAWNAADCSTAEGVGDAAMSIATDCGALL